MTEVNVEKEKAKYQKELDELIKGLQTLEAQRIQQLQAINEHRGIIIFLASFGKEETAKVGLD